LELLSPEPGCSSDFFASLSFLWKQDRTTLWNSLHLLHDWAEKESQWLSFFLKRNLNGNQSFFFQLKFLHHLRKERRCAMSERNVLYCKGNPPSDEPVLSEHFAKGWLLSPNLGL
jgi:hypothetical protein